MRKHCFRLAALLAALLLMPLGTSAQTFTYTHQGQTVLYQVLDGWTRTVKTVDVNLETGARNFISGDLVLPEHPVNGDVEYTLVSLGSESFMDNTALTSVVIPNSVTEIGTAAFEGCISLGKIVIPASVEKIKSAAFMNCRPLDELKISASVSFLGTAIAAGCVSLKSIDVDERNREYKAVDGVLYNMLGTKLLQYPAGKPDKHFSIPASVIAIEDRGFLGCEWLESVEIPASVESIDFEAFLDCGKLREVTIPASVTSLGGHVFNGCRSLSSIGVEESNPAYKSVDGVVYYEANADIGEMLMAYPAGKPDESFTLPPTVKIIAAFAFAENTNLVSVEFPQSLTEIYAEAFTGCTRLSSVKIPASVTAISENVFSNCPALKKIVLPATTRLLVQRAFGNCVSLETVECHAATPPEFRDFSYDKWAYWAFAGSPVENITLRVPEGCREVYAAAEGWDRFGTIVDDLKPGDDAVDATTLDATPAPRDIYNMQGILLKRDGPQAASKS